MRFVRASVPLALLAVLLIPSSAGAITRITGETDRFSPDDSEQITIEGDAEAADIEVAYFEDHPTGSATIGRPVLRFRSRNGSELVSRGTCVPLVQQTGLRLIVLCPVGFDGRIEEINGDLGGGNDVLEVIGAQAELPRLRISGGPGADRITGGPDRDIIAGGGGADELSGSGGNDQLSGGPGNDILRGDAGNETFVTEPGADAFHGGPGRDTLSYQDASGPVTVTLDGAANDGTGGGSEGDNVGGTLEVIVGTSGPDSLTGGPNADELRGGAGDDELNGLGGDDVLQPGTGNDAVRGAREATPPPTLTVQRA